jgi:beta-glucosidase
MPDVADALLQRMSLAEKVGQLNHLSAAEDTTGAGGAAADLDIRIRRGEVGSLGGGVSMARLRELQTIAVEQSPSKLPLMFTLDVIHGHRTIFPLPLGLACSWDADLIGRTARVAATEAAAAGITLAWAPMLDVSRDARWGRCAESPGEDAVLGAMFARAMIGGYQQQDLARPDSVMATAKHFAGYGFAEGGRDYNAADISAYRMHNVVLPPFKAAIDAGVGAVMAGFHDLAGIPCTAHSELLGELLRRRWGFDGLIVSDYTAILELVHHGVAEDAKAAALLAFNAGVDIDLASGIYIQYLPQLVQEGRIAASAVDRACLRVLRAKARLGLFQQPYRGLDEARQAAVMLTSSSRQLAREAATKSCVLLKNNGVLPFVRRDVTFAVVGPLADSRANMQGTWAVAAREADSVTVLDGIRSAVGSSGRVLYCKGANIVDDPNIAARLDVFGTTAPIDQRSPGAMIKEAVACAKGADVVIACVGEAKEHTGESSTRADIGLPGSQRELVKALHETGKPLVLLTMSGRPLALEWESHNVDTILHCWFPGTEAGNAVADLLFGDANPCGKLAMSFPRSAGQCPIFYAEAPTGRPLDKIGIDVRGDREVDGHGRQVFRKFTTACRLDGPHTPLYPFGYGLSYSTFAYADLAVDKAVLDGAGDVLQATVTVSNKGRFAGEEIVQLYIGDPVASRSRAVRELKQFHKVMLSPGEQRNVGFKITVNDLKFSRADRLADSELIWEPGTFVIEVGGCSDDLLAASVQWRGGR